VQEGSSKRRLDLEEQHTKIVEMSEYH
jgi:hypothetical protein